MPEGNSITVAIAALNEEAGLAWATVVIVEALQRHFDQYEILLFDDGSTDNTSRIADELAVRFDHITVIHHQRPHGLGGVIRAGLERARMRYFIWCDGKGATSGVALNKIFALRGQADLVIPYAANQWQRSRMRRLTSRIFQSLLNTLFRLELHQYTHLVLSEAAEARRYLSRSNSYAAQAEMLIRMIRVGYSYVEVGVADNFEFEWNHTKAFRLRNIVGIGALLLRLLWRIYVLGEAPSKTMASTSVADGAPTASGDTLGGR